MLSKRVNLFFVLTKKKKSNKQTLANRTASNDASKT